jgi:thioredoxin-dependent peroxiredoxin
MKRSGIWAASAVLLAASSAYAFRAPAPDLIATGSAAPAFTLPSQDTPSVSLSDYKGKWVVLYFYPKDKTQGCTIEAHNFQRDLPKYQAANAVVLGVSLDTADSHRSFCSKESLTFKLLADTEHKVTDAYGVPVKGMGPMKYAERDTILIDPSGKVAKTWSSVDPNTHSEDVLATLASLKK